MNMNDYIIPILVGVALCFIPKINYVSKTFVTLTHELGHAIVVVPFGGRISGIRLRANTEGEATTSLPQFTFPFYQILRIINLFAGYSMPLYVGALLTIGVVVQEPIMITVMFVIASIILLFFIRNLFGLLIALLFISMNIIACFVLPVSILYGYTLCVATMLILGGIRDILQITGWVVRKEIDDSDFHIASRELWFPPLVWLILFWLVHISIFGCVTWWVVSTAAANTA